MIEYLNQPQQQNVLWDIYATGGYLKSDSSLFTGPGAVHNLSLYHANHAFLSVGGLLRLYNTSESVVETERVMIERSDLVHVLADGSKLGSGLCVMFVI